MNPNPAIFVTEQDLARLDRLLATSAKTPNVTQLEEELSRAVAVPAEKISPDVVTMNSRVRFADVDTGEESEVTLTYPQDADTETSKVSILAPVGAALIGLSVGETIAWPMPSGKQRRLRIMAVPYQPEAAGDFHL